ncbi:hypothetical protein AMJ96_CH00604 [Rhizobium sp. N113]|uniref:S-4TM family putative pore-forming effector n=1 Tax=Rhizobium TaxID=379 RepID=UPI0007EB3FDB|nr:MULTISPECIES: S-4TM family putative pore-forming effector [Rhizobium]ANL02195.1 hypothetical protein AMJ99_CH00600 [Rhizobium esperanzae]ANL08323.1 hypothetical protein AMJ98_CH00600 [Rhizobium sp. N1341]ANL20372.1 hypothetical protein AMJ96_CH00604 [Rhizobium sp. N113]ANM33046.1 hypothetical protein AMK04_CH00600 [Rhizobium sp. N871]ANM39164.1 hypothetical protein AMK03_CH00600 [Rhizobium sp. N741]
MNDIIEKQDTEEFQLLLQARTGTYKLATFWQVVQVIMTVVVPVIFSLVALHWTWLRPYLACYTLAASSIDVLIVDRIHRSFVKKAALFSEMFDTRLFQLPWNAFVAGKPVPPEDVLSASKYCPSGQMDKLIGWYPVVVQHVPLSVARLVCQRTNLSYDSRIRARFSFILMWVPVVYVVALFPLALAQDLSFQDMVLNVVSPFSAVLIWSVRERYRQLDAISANDALRADVESAWTQLIPDSENPAEDSESRARQLQDGIFSRRSQSPLTFPLVYRFMRSSSEDVMNYGADRLLRQAGYTVPAGGAQV